MAFSFRAQPGDGIFHKGGPGPSILCLLQPAVFPPASASCASQSWQAGGRPRLLRSVCSLPACSRPWLYALAVWSRRWIVLQGRGRERPSAVVDVRSGEYHRSQQPMSRPRSRLCPEGPAEASTTGASDQSGTNSRICSSISSRRLSACSTAFR